MDYCTQQDIEDLFSPADVAKWADNQNDGNATYISGRITRACAEGTRKVNDELRGGPYPIPFTTVPSTIVQLAATFAAVWLYTSRGVQDMTDDSIAGRLSAHRRDAVLQCRRILAGQLQLDSTRAGVAIPEVVEDDSSDDEEETS